MFPIHPLWRTTALLCVAFALCILIFGLGAATVDPTDPAFRNAVMLAAGVTIGAIAATGVGAVVAAQARPRAHARAEPKTDPPKIPTDEELRRELTAYRTTSPARADAVLRAQRQHRMDYWHERATTLLDEGDVRGAMADIVRSAADSLDPTVLSDTRLFAGQATRQLARMVEELCDRNAELAGRVVAGIGHSAAAMAQANEEAIDPDNPRRELEDVTDGELMQEAIERGLVRMGAEVEPTSGLH